MKKIISLLCALILLLAGVQQTLLGQQEAIGRIAQVVEEERVRRWDAEHKPSRT